MVVVVSTAAGVGVVPSGPQLCRVREGQVQAAPVCPRSANIPDFSLNWDVLTCLSGCLQTDAPPGEPPAVVGAEGPFKGGCFHSRGT